MTEDVWVKSAMKDDDIVAELLLRIKHSSADQIPLMLPPVRWGSYKIRSSAIRKEKSEPMRCSPKTPLSWSGGGGGLGGGGGGTSASDLCEESSRGSDGKSIARSKGAFCIDNGSNSDIDKRFRKKMGISELKEEEMVQMKENIHLKKVIEKLRMTVDEQKDENQSLKRRKLSDGFLLQSSSSTCLEERTEKIEKIEKVEGRKFVLPDLNLLPVDEDDEEPIQSSWR
ncbi:uncharacterized protein LOC124944131 [Impatiens glandulifera]|uniref:uncharacterized protein LOC124944131 n=1 Tax=Impatiens glandulifera TaxID=253017 RepID=UPI001FB0DCD1|nr:uncharacterized protein LOC124944131 [Impatiens glandulifera]